MWNFPLRPPADSSLAARVDHLFYAWLALAGVVTAAIFVLIVYFSVRYRHGSRADRSLPPRPTTASRRPGS
jgi:cytochrome c oxidase subunit 2